MPRRRGSGIRQQRGRIASENTIQRGQEKMALEAPLGDNLPMPNMAIIESSEEVHPSFVLPFTKESLAVWRGFEDMEPFKSLPQNPHFGPLEKENLWLREGMAVGYMTRFANLYETIHNITNSGDPRSMLEACMKKLDEFEQVGFFVQPLRDTIKERYLQFLEEEIVYHEKEREEVQASISDLNMQLQLLERVQEMRKLTSTELEKKMDDIKENMRNVKLAFESELAAPWP